MIYYHAVKNSGFTYDANGNLTAKPGLSLSWDHENRLSSAGGESYLYDDAGIRVKKWGSGYNIYYPFAHYEQSGSSTVTKYYFFNGQRIAMRKGGTLYYLHADHLGGTAVETNSSGNAVTTQSYYAYGKRRSGGAPITDYRFTGQKLDGTGLMYYQARYYDPATGTFLSPDTLVPDATNVFDYNRYMMVRGNPLNHTDSSGHCIDGVTTVVCVAVVAALVGGTANAVGDASAQIYNNWDSERGVVENLNDFNKVQSAIAFGFGAVSGATAPFTGPAGSIAINSTLGGAQQVTTDMVINGKTFDEALGTDTLIAASMGGAGSIIQGAIPDELVYVSKSRLNGEVLDTIGFATGKDAVANGGSWFASGTNAMLSGEQKAYIVGSRYITGATVGNISTPQAESCGNIFSCAAESISSWWNGDENE